MRCNTALFTHYVRFCGLEITDSHYQLWLHTSGGDKDLTGRLPAL